MHERAGELDQPLVEGIVWTSAILKPEFLEDIVSFEEELPIEALEIAEVMSVEFLPSASFDQSGNRAALFGQG
jgi:hypothetical protein